MKNVLKIILTLLILSFFSCNPTDSGEIVNFKITNSSDEEIELVYLSTVFNEAKTADDNIDINNSIEIEFSFRDVTKSDGAYRISFMHINSSDTITEEFGYYTNGFPLNEKFDITIYQDSLDIRGK